MNTAELMSVLESQETLLPKDILEHISEEKLAQELLEIYKSHASKLRSDALFRTRYLDLVNYLLLLNIRRDKKERKNFFNQKMISSLLSYPEAA